MERILDLTKRSADGEKILGMLQNRIIGQDGAIKALDNIVTNYLAGFNDPRRPAGNALFLGPTGTGKTYTVESFCEGLFGDDRALIKVDCAEFQHSHEIAKLIGSPPGYLGHRETHPILTQESLNAYHTDKLKLSVVLFDEIEKASDALWLLLLGILDKATLTLGDNRRVNFNQTIIIMTSNLGSDQMQKLTNGGMGFNSKSLLDAVIDSNIEEVAKQAAKRKFTPEFYNRLENVVVFKTLGEPEIKKILQIELGRLQSSITRSERPFFFSLDEEAKKTLMKDGYDKNYGARHIRRSIDKHIRVPLAKLFASGQISPRDAIRIREVGKEEFEFAVVEGGLQ